MKKWLGLDLAQHCGVAELEIADESSMRRLEPDPRFAWTRASYEGAFVATVRGAFVLDLTHKGELYGKDKLPLGGAMSAWLARCQDALMGVIRYFAEKGGRDVVMEVPDNFMLGYRPNRQGLVRKVSTPQTISSMMRLSGVAFAAFGAVEQIYPWMQLHVVSATQWQKPMFHGVPLNGLLEFGAVSEKDTKAKSLAAAWYHLGFATESSDESDAALLALWKYKQVLWEAERDEQLKLELGRKNGKST